MAATAQTIETFVNELLEADRYRDYGPNGIQVEGHLNPISKICTAVSCTESVFAQAAAESADALLVHHGLFWKSTPQAITGVMRRRLDVLFKGNISLLAWHLPLDGSYLLGNNILMLNALDAVTSTEKTFGSLDSTPGIGRYGTVATALTTGELAARVTAATAGLLPAPAQAPLVLGAERSDITEIAVCSGGGGHFLEEAAALGAHAIICGEPEEPTNALGKELGVSVIAAGHYATETLGIFALGEHLSKHFGFEHKFIADQNPV